MRKSQKNEENRKEAARKEYEQVVERNEQVIKEARERYGK